MTPDDLPARPAIMPCAKCAAPVDIRHQKFPSTPTNISNPGGPESAYRLSFTSYLTSGCLGRFRHHNRFKIVR